MNLPLMPCTSFFHLADPAALTQHLATWSLHEDVGARWDANGRVMLYALHGAASWPCEWTPGTEGDEAVDFDPIEMVSALAAGGQAVAVRTDEEVVEISLGGALPPRPR